MRLVTTLLIVSTVVVLVSCRAALARTWYIDPDGTGDVANIQTAIDSASPGDTVLLATGKFTGPGNTNVDFMGKAVTVTSVDGVDATFIDCGDTTRAFIFQTNEGPSSVLSGVTIQNGFDNFSGGAIFCRSASPTIIGNTFIGSGLLFQAFQGGAIYCDSSSAVVTQNTFSGNSAIEGGGLWCSGLSDITVTRNVFRGNSANNGGGIACNSSSPLIADNTFEGNWASFGGAIDVLVESQPTISNNTFDGNQAGSGGAIRCQESPTSGQSAVFSENIFRYNDAAYFGGAIYCEEISIPTISNNTFDENQAMSEGGGGIYCKDFSDADILNNIIFNSTGGAIATDDTSVPMISCCDVFPPAVLPDHRGDKNFFRYPKFCNPDSGNYYLQSYSPCAADSQPDCGLIGARPLGCTLDVTGVDDTPRGRTSLDQNFPNPFNPVTTISFELPEQAGRVTLKVFDVEGRLVRTLADERRPPGRNFVTWDGANDTGTQVASGVYFYHLRTSGYRKTRKMVLLK